MVRQEWKRLLKNPILVVVLIAILLIPSIYAGLFLASMWDPYGDLDQLPVAVVNLDQPVEYRDETLTIGEDLAENLAEDGSLDFHFVDQAEAEQGLKSGAYYMVVTIPEDFSRCASTVLDETPETMRLSYQTNPATNYVASKLSESAMTKIELSLQEEVTKTYAEALFTQLDGIGDSLQEAADGAQELRDGETGLVDGADQLAEGTQSLADGASELNDGANALQSGTSELRSGVNSYLAGANQVDQGVSELSGGASALADGTATLAEGAAALSDGVDSLAGQVPALVSGVSDLEAGAGQLSGGLAELNGSSQALSDGAAAVSGGVTALESGVNTAFDQLQGGSASFAGAIAGLSSAGSVADALESGDLSESTVGAAVALLRAASTVPGAYSAVDAGIGAARQGVLDGVAQLSGGAASLSAGIDAYTAGVASAAEGASQLYAGINQLSSGASALTDGVSQLQDGAHQVSAGADSARDGAAQVAGGSAALAGGTAQLVGNNGALASGAAALDQGAAELADGTGELVSGSRELNDGAHELKDGLPELTDGTEELQSGLQDGADEVRDANTGEANSQMVAAPVEVEETQITTVSDNGHAMAAYMMSVGLWVACLAFCLMYPLTEHEGITSGFKWWLSKASVLYPMAVLQALLLIAILHVTLGFQPVHMAQTILMAVLASSAFMAIMYYFNVLLGKVGSFLMLIFMVLQLAGSAGTYPIELSGPLAAALHALVPFTYTVNAFRSTIGGGEPYPECIAVLVGILVVFSLLTVLLFLLRGKKEQTGRKDLHDWMEAHGLA